MDQAAECHVADHRPTEFDNLLLGVELPEFVEECLVDVLVVDVQALCEVQRSLLPVCELMVAPRANATNGVLVEGLSFP